MTGEENFILANPPLIYVPQSCQLNNEAIIDLHQNTENIEKYDQSKRLELKEKTVIINKGKMSNLKGIQLLSIPGINLSIDATDVMGLYNIKSHLDKESIKKAYAEKFDTLMEASLASEGINNLLMTGLGAGAFSGINTKHGITSEISSQYKHMIINEFINSYNKYKTKLENQRITVYFSDYEGVYTQVPEAGINVIKGEFWKPIEELNGLAIVNPSDRIQNGMYAGVGHEALEEKLFRRICVPMYDTAKALGANINVVRAKNLGGLYS